jgi:predicted RNase H-like HicB family nuclease
MSGPDDADYTVLVHRSDDGSYRAEVEELPELEVVAASLTELLDAFEKALSDHLSHGDRTFRVLLTHVENPKPGRVERYEARILVG